MSSSSAVAPPLEPILEFAATAPDPALRMEALTVAAGHGAGEPRVRGQLGRLARDDPDPDVRETARSLLEGLDKPD